MAAKRPDMFPDAPRSAPPPAPAPPGPLVTETDWRVIDHVCGACFARLVGRAKDGDRFYRCTGCGRESVPGAPSVERLPPPGRRQAPAICACHLKFAGRDAGIRCVVNDHRSLLNPTEIVARQIR